MSLRATQLSVAYAASQGHGVVWDKTAPKVRSGSITLPQQPSVLMSLAPVTTKFSEDKAAQSWPFPPMAAGGGACEQTLMTLKSGRAVKRRCSSCLSFLTSHCLLQIVKAAPGVMRVGKLMLSLTSYRPFTSPEQLNRANTVDKWQLS